MGLDWIEQFERLHMVENYDAMLVLLKRIDSIHISDKFRLMAAEALNACSEPDYRKAFDYLNDCSPAFSATYMWNLQMGIALYYLDRESEALNYFERASNCSLMTDCDEKLSFYLTSCVDLISRPMFNRGFIERIDAFWQAFECLEEELIKALEIVDEDWCYANHLVSELLWKQFKDVHFQLEILQRPDECPEIILKIFRKNIKQFVLNELMDRMPSNLEKRWSLRIVNESLPNNCVVYSFSPSLETDKRIREDVYIGVSCFSDWLDINGEFKREIFDEAYRNGITLGYIYYAVEAEDQVYDIINQVILSTDCKTIGSALGLKYNYIDLMIFDFDSFFSRIQKSLKNISAQVYFKTLPAEAEPIRFL